MKELLCRLGLHDFTNWSKPKKEKDTYWGYKGSTQQRICRRCNQHDVREL